MQRINYIDNLKGFAILLVVMGHVTEWSINSNGTAWNHLYGSFHMPLFMFLSGVFAYKDFSAFSIIEIKNFLRKKALRILIPFIVIGGGYSIITKGTLYSVYMGNIGGYWFLPALFYCMLTGMVVSWILKNLSQRPRLWLDVLAHFTMFITLLGIYYLVGTTSIPYFLHFIKMYPLFIMGVLFNRHVAVKQAVCTSTVYTLSLLLYMLFWWWQPPVKIIFTVFFAIVVLVQLFIRYDQHFPPLIKTLGRYSLEIYVFHYFFLPPLTRLGAWIQNQGATPISSKPFLLEMLVSLVFAIPIIALCIIVARVVQHSSWLNAIMFGVLPKQPTSSPASDCSISSHRKNLDIEQ